MGVGGQRIMRQIDKVQGSEMPEDYTGVSEVVQTLGLVLAEEVEYTVVVHAAATENADHK